MPSLTLELFRRAIDEKLQIVCVYDGFPREVCPHVAGYGPMGGEHALVYQFAGQSSKGLSPGGDWRCFELHLVRNAVLREGSWHTGLRHSKQQSCVRRVVAEVAF